MRESARVHAAVAGVFFAFGAGVGLWGGAAGAILARAHIDPAAFGALLTAYTAAYLIAMSAAGALAHRFGVKRVLRVSAMAFGAALCALLNAGSAPLVGGLLIISGLGGVVDVTMNAEGARIERRLGRPILARLHAAASAGMAIGAILGSLIVAGRPGRPGSSPRSGLPRPVSPMGGPRRGSRGRLRSRSRPACGASPSRRP